MDGSSPFDPSATPRPGELKPPADLPDALTDLRASGWESVPVAEEMRRNTAKLIAAGETLVPGVLGFEDTVVPQLENAILAGHDIILLGERGQAKTRVIRSMVGLLDEWMPIVDGSLVGIPFTGPTLSRTVALAQRGGRALARPARALADQLLARHVVPRGDA